MSSDEEFDQFDGHDEYVGIGSMQPTLGDSDTTILFRDLQHELEALVQNYHVPPNELDQLFQVVQSMFDLMDANKEQYEAVEAEKKELEMLWKQEKDKLRQTQMRKLELESRLEEEMMKIESAKTDLEKEKVALTTKLKQVGEHKNTVEQELQKLKERTSKEEQTRKELLEQYKKQTDVLKTATLRRVPVASPMLQGKRRTLPYLPKKKQLQESRLTTSIQVKANESSTPADTALQQSVERENLAESAEIPEEPFNSKDETTFKNATINRKSMSLADELEMLESPHQNGNGTQPEEHNSQEEEEEEEEESDDDEMWYQYETAEGIPLTEELMGVDPALGRMEVEMLQKEKEMWEEDRSKLEREKTELREKKEALERQNAELEVELRRARKSNQDINDKLSEVKKERDEILDNYLEQPFDEYCITRRELHALLTKHHDTTMELEKAKEEKRRLQRLLDSKRGFLERVKERLSKMFSKKTEERTIERVVKPPQPSPYTFPTPFIRSLASVLSGGNMVIEKGWLKSHAGHVTHDKLPQWLGQITLKGFETDRIECIAVGRIFNSPVDIFPGHLTPPRFRAARRNHQVSTLNGIQQTHAEVWVATVEQSMANIEIIDVLAKPVKVRQTFLLRPKTKHIVCMKAIPGAVEESKDFADSASLNYKTDWVETSYLSSGLPGRRTSDLSPLFKQRGDRPRSAPQKPPRAHRSHADLMIGSSPDLYRCRSTGSRDSTTPVEDDLQLFTASTPAMPSTGSNRIKDNGILASNSSSSSLATIDEVENTPEQEKGHKEGENQESEERKEDKDDSEAGPEEDEKGADNTDGSFSILEMDESDSSREATPSHVTSTPIRKSSTNSNGKQSHLDISPLAKQDSTKGLGLTKTQSNGAIRRFPSDDDMGLETPDKKMQSLKNKHISNQDGKSPIMWIITENNYIYFYPTTDPSHRPLNSVKIKSRATCMEYVAGKVFVGHVQSSLTVYHKDEFAPSWDVENPEEISLPCLEPSDHDEVKCIAQVGDRIWVGVGSRIFFLNADNPSSREGSIPMDAWRQKPEHIVSLGEVVAVATRKGSTVFFFDAQSAHLLRKFDIVPLTRLLNVPLKTVSTTTTPVSMPTDIKAMVADNHMLYIGTSNGRIVTIPKEKILEFKQEEEFLVISFDDVDKGKAKASKEGKGSTLEERECLDSSAVGIHSHKDSRVRGLVSIQLPSLPPSTLREAVDGGVPYHSLPNLNSPFGIKMPVTPPILSYKSLVISAGKGHVEYIENSDPELEESMSGALRERNEAFQLQCWGHRNIVQ